MKTYIFCFVCCHSVFLSAEDSNGIRLDLSKHMAQSIAIRVITITGKSHVMGSSVKNTTKKQRQKMFSQYKY